MTTLSNWMSDGDLDPYVESALEDSDSEFSLQDWRECIDGPEGSWLEQGKEFLAPLGIKVTDCRECSDADELEWLVEEL